MEKMNTIKAMLITGLISLCGSSLYAGSPAPPAKNKTDKPTQQLQSWCEVRGVLERVTDSDGSTLLICRMVSNSFCYSVPCMFGMPVGNKPLIKNPVPQGVNIEEGQNFIAYYDSHDVLQVVFTDHIDASLTSDEQGNELLTVKLPK